MLHLIRLALTCPYLRCHSLEGPGPEIIKVGGGAKKFLAMDGYVTLANNRCGRAPSHAARRRAGAAQRKGAAVPNVVCLGHSRDCAVNEFALTGKRQTECVTVNVQNGSQKVRPGTPLYLCAGCIEGE